MNASFITKPLQTLLLVACILTVSACKKMLDVKPKDVLDSGNMYRNVYDADAAVWGIYGKYMNLAERYILFNELRADLVQPTMNADANLQQLSNHDVRPDNPYINPKPFYEVILNCNDAMFNFRKMLDDKKLKENEFNERYSDVAAMRSWVYLQLGIHYGSVPYVTDPVATINDLRNQTKYPKISFDALLDSLVQTMESLPYQDEYPSSSTMRTIVDQIPTQKAFINKSILLGDIYLWRSKAGDYTKAASNYKKVMEYGEQFRAISIDQWYHYYKIWNANLTISYSGDRPDPSLLADDNNSSWRQMFARNWNENPFVWEWIWVLPFDRKFQPANPFIDLFSPTGGRYLLMPSQAAIDNWNSQTSRNGLPYDSRGIYSWRNINGQPVVMKYLYNYINVNGNPIGTIFDRDGKWFLYRAPTLHLHFSEAANRDNRHKLAYALVNRGITFHYDGPGGDKTPWMHTLNDPIPAYQFDGRNGNNPQWRSAWHRSVGIRGRAYVTSPVITGDSLTKIEDMIINEGALETAFEGHRWPDLLRVAMRRNDPAFLADKIYNKLIKSGTSAGAAGQARARLMNRDWYLPFKW